VYCKPKEHTFIQGYEAGNRGPLIGPGVFSRDIKLADTYRGKSYLTVLSDSRVTILHGY
jgi:hypothetical protein